jgi:hypothetical protein
MADMGGIAVRVIIIIDVTIVLVSIARPLLITDSDVVGAAISWNMDYDGVTSGNTMLMLLLRRCRTLTVLGAGPVRPPRFSYT